MSVSFRQVWSDPSAGVMGVAELNERRLYELIGDFAPGETQGDAPGVAFWWGAAGDDASGGQLVDPDYPPLVWVQTLDSRDLSSISQLGRYGPIQDPDDTHMAADLFFWRTERGSYAWKTVAYLAGLNSGGYFDTQGAARSFIAYCLGGAP